MVKRINRAARLLVVDSRTSRLISIKRQITQLRRSEKRLKKELSAQPQNEALANELLAELTMTLASIEQLTERLGRVEAEP